MATTINIFEFTPHFDVFFFLLSFVAIDAYQCSLTSVPMLTTSLTALKVHLQSPTAGSAVDINEVGENRGRAEEEGTAGSFPGRRGVVVAEAE